MLKALPVHKAHKVPLAQTVLMAQLVPLVHKALKVLPAQMAQLVPKDPLAHKVHKALQGRQDRKAHKVLLALMTKT